MKIVRISLEEQQSRDGESARPLGTENFGQLLKVLNGCLSDREYRIL